MFVLLHTKSEHSPGYGTASADDLLRRAAGYGYPALALTDVENLYGQVKFHHAARLRGIKPITGVELRSGYGPRTLGEKERRLILLARDHTGYQTLCRVITRRRGGIIYEPDAPATAAAPRAGASGSPQDDPIHCLDAEPRGVFFLSDDASVLQELLRAGVPAADLRFLLVRPGGGPPPADIRCVADPDVVMADPADHDLHVLQVAIRRRQKVYSVLDTEPPQRSLPAPAIVRRLFQNAPEAIVETLRVAEACSLDLRIERPKLPILEPNAGENPNDRLERVCRERFADGRRLGKWTALPYEERLSRELTVLRHLDLGGYFLIVAEITDRARQEGIAVAGRGSAGASLVAHVLGITPIDPIEHGLYFERFVHTHRKDLPDIDLDLPSDRRDGLIDWVFRRFGSERVAMVSAHQTFGQRAAFREGLKALGMVLADVDRFCDRLPAEELEPQAAAPLLVDLLPERYREAVPLITRLIGKMQHISVHPGGVVIAEPRIDHYAPLERAPKGVLVTQYDMHSLEKLGLVKIDLLGNRALGAVQETLRWIGGQGEAPDGDPATLQTLRESRTVGCFQIETPAMRATLRRLPVRGIKDVVAALAIVRPGPASGEAKAAFIRRANGEEPARPPHPRLAERLRETYGMMLYEEDIMAAISALTGWSLERADEMRAALVSADDAVLPAQLQREFRDASVRNGVTKEEAAAVWTILARFVAYSFNKAHAVGYANLAWQTAYLKTHYPVPFACAVLNSYGGLYPLRTLAADFTRHGVRLLAPHVNFSGRLCQVESGAVRVGLSAIKHLTMKNRKNILDRRPFQDFRDFLEKVPLSYRELEAVVLCGACDGLEPLVPEAYPIAHEELLARLRQERSSRALEDFVTRWPAGPRVETYRALARIRNELTFLNIHLCDHPMRVLREEAVRAGCVTTSELAARTGQFARIAVVVAATRRLATRDGQLMQFVTFEDEYGLVEAVLFPGTYASLGDPVTNPGPFLVGGRVAEDHGDLHLIVSDLTPFYRRPRPYGRG
jgi:DNA-directed DNA polymerase III PolC